MLVIRRLFGAGTNCIAPSGLPLLLCLFPGLAPWAFLSRPCGASFAPESNKLRERIDARKPRHEFHELDELMPNSMPHPWASWLGVQALACPARCSLKPELIRNPQFRARACFRVIREIRGGLFSWLLFLRQ